MLLYNDKFWVMVHFLHIVNYCNTLYSINNYVQYSVLVVSWWNVYKSVTLYGSSTTDCYSAVEPTALCLSIYITGLCCCICMNKYIWLVYLTNKQVRCTFTHSKLLFLLSWQLYVCSTIGRSNVNAKQVIVNSQCQFDRSFNLHSVN